MQHTLTRIVDRCAAQGLVEKYTAEQRWDDLERLQDLVADDANHEWLWAVSSKKNNVMNDKDYVGAIRLRLGCGGPEELATCGNCGGHIMGGNGTHGLLC